MPSQPGMHASSSRHSNYQLLLSCRIAIHTRYEASYIRDSSGWTELGNERDNTLLGKGRVDTQSRQTTRYGSLLNNRQTRKQGTSRQTGTHTQICTRTRLQLCGEGGSARVVDTYIIANPVKYFFQI